ADIAILRMLGASPASILVIFLVQGTMIGLFGTLLGVVAGVLLSLNVTTIVPFIEHVFHTHFLSASVYYISELPSHLRWQDVLHVAFASFLMSFLATVYPAWRAAKTQPAEALRYE
ncbi:MAG: FtsX-like permease family protein, partial [Acidiferrobacter sp.]